MNLHDTESFLVCRAGGTLGTGRLSAFANESSVRKPTHKVVKKPLSLCAGVQIGAAGRFTIRHSFNRNLIMATCTLTPAILLTCLLCVAPLTAFAADDDSVQEVAIPVVQETTSATRAVQESIWTKTPATVHKISPDRATIAVAHGAAQQLADQQSTSSRQRQLIALDQRKSPWYKF
jgi:hypothetical protein